MGSALFISLDNEVSGLDTLMDGKAISNHDNTIRALCRAAGVPDLWSFFSENPDELSEFLDEEFVDGAHTDSDSPSSVPAEQWFSPDDGLRVVSALIRSLEADPTQTAPDTSIVLEDLRNMDRILRAAGKAGCLWHLSVDF